MVQLPNIRKFVGFYLNDASTQSNLLCYSLEQLEIRFNGLFSFQFSVYF